MLSDVGDFSNPALKNNAVIDPESPASECGRFQLHLADSIDLPIDFDLGLDAIVFQVATEGGITLSLGYDIEIGVGLDKATGAFLVINDDVDEAVRQFCEILVPGGKVAK